MFFNISLRLILPLLNGGICVLGDQLVEWNSGSHLQKAICDNATHAFIGFVNALTILYELNRRISWTERVNLVIMSMLVSSLIDLDHFIVAKSMNLTKATSLKQRPFLHCTTIPVVFLGLLLLIHRYFYSFRCCLWFNVFICAFLSHHTRDATRRGFWCCPLGNTRPLPYVAYIICIAAMPHIFAVILNISTANGYSNRHQLIETV